MERRKGLRILSVLALTGCVALMSPSALSRPMDPASEALFSDRTVIASGTGEAEDVAETDACRAAVEDVIKSLLSPAVIKESKDALDTILSKPMDYIVSHEKLESRQTNDGGPWEVKVKAVISEDLLKAEFKTKNITRREIDGEALYEALTSGRAAKEKLSNRFRESFRIPDPKELCFTSILTQTGEPLLDPNKQSLRSAFTVLDSGEKTGKVQLGFRVTVEVDLEAWEEWASEAREALAGFATKSGVFKMGTYGANLKHLDAEPGGLQVKPVGDWYALVKPRLKKYDYYGTWQKIRSQKLSFTQLHREVGAEVTAHQLLILVPKSRRLDQQWEWYQIPRDPLLVDMVRMLVLSHPSDLFVSLEDEAKENIAGTLLEGAAHEGFHCLTAEAVYEQFTAHRKESQSRRYRGSAAYGHRFDITNNSDPSELFVQEIKAVALLPGFSKQNIVVHGYELSVVVELPLEDVKKLRWVEAGLRDTNYRICRSTREISAKGTYMGPESSWTPAVPFYVRDLPLAEGRSGD